MKVKELTLQNSRKSSSVVCFAWTIADGFFDSWDRRKFTGFSNDLPLLCLFFILTKGFLNDGVHVCSATMLADRKKNKHCEKGFRLASIKKFLRRTED